MGHKQLLSSATLNFPSGRKRHTDAARRAMAKLLVELDPSAWHCLMSPLPKDDERYTPWQVAESIRASQREHRVAASLERWGMIERHPANADCVRWSVLHERPIFGRDKEGHDLYGQPVRSLSREQKSILTECMMCYAMKQHYDVLVLNDTAMQRRLRALERRGLLAIERMRGVWRLQIGEKYRPKSKTT